MRLNFHRYSESGKPLLILHGLFASLGNWGWHSKELSKHYSVIGVDLRNHGDSPHDKELNYPVMALDVVKLIESLGLSSVAIIGHSMGGKVAMELALQHPQFIEKLVVVDIAPVAYPDRLDSHKGIIDGMKALNLSEVKNRGEADIFLAPYIEEEPTRKFILTNLVHTKEGGYKWRLNLDAIEKNYGNLREKPTGIGTYESAILFVKGALSDYIKPENEAEILDLFPNAQVKIIMQAGHWLHVDKPQAFQKIVSDFLAEKD